MINLHKQLALAPTGTAGAYSANDVYGGLLTAQIADDPDIGGWVVAVSLDDDDDIKAACHLHLFNAAPTGINDNAALSLSKADRAKRVACIPIASADYVVIGGKGQALLTERSFAFRSPSGYLWAYLSMDATPTFVTTTPLTLTLTLYLS